MVKKGVDSVPELEQLVDKYHGSILPTEFTKLMDITEPVKGHSDILKAYSVLAKDEETLYNTNQAIKATKKELAEHVNKLSKSVNNTWYKLLNEIDKYTENYLNLKIAKASSKEKGKLTREFNKEYNHSIVHQGKVNKKEEIYKAKSTIDTYNKLKKLGKPSIPEEDKADLQKINDTISTLNNEKTTQKDKVVESKDNVVKAKSSNTIGDTLIKDNSLSDIRQKNLKTVLESKIEAMDEETRNIIKTELGCAK